ncbi:MAG: CDP-diacylglycerol--serine O-phosphatidyltransferase [bacterium]|nr:CDP-diacylglycerol--serine O-phosphatidyltransferase [bacterium]
MRVTRSIVPNLFTLANLFCGFTAIIAATDGQFERSVIFILTAGVFDMLDGVVARLTRSTSEFGVELDSLCDAVSFGVAPSILLYSVYFHELHQWGVLLSSLPALAGVLRLARFNVQLTSMEDKLYFRGMPIPAGALVLSSYVLFVHLGTDLTSSWTLPDTWKPAGILITTLLTAGAMVSTIKYDNLPRPTMRSLRQRPLVFLVFLVGLVASVVTAGRAIFPFMMLYMIGGAIRHAVLFMRTRSDDDNDTLEEPDPDPYEL